MLHVAGCEHDAVDAGNRPEIGALDLEPSPSAVTATEPEEGVGPHAVGPVLDSGETGPRLLQVVGVHQVEDVTTAQLSGGAAQQELAQRTHPSDAECIIDDHDPVSGGVEQRQGGRARPTRMHRLVAVARIGRHLASSVVVPERASLADPPGSPALGRHVMIGEPRTDLNTSEPRRPPRPTFNESRGGV